MVCPIKENCLIMNFWVWKVWKRKKKEMITVESSSFCSELKKRVTTSLANTDSLILFENAKCLCPILPYGTACWHVVDPQPQHVLFYYILLRGKEEEQQKVMVRNSLAVPPWTLGVGPNLHAGPVFPNVTVFSFFTVVVTDTRRCHVIILEISRMLILFLFHDNHTFF